MTLLLTPIQIAEVCHEMNRTWCACLGDDSQTSWTAAPGWQRVSALKGVEFHLENPDAGPEASHESWLAEKVNTGWSYGPVKDADLKTHPCFVPFDQLPLDQQFKDKLFKLIVDTFREKEDDQI